MTHALNSSEEAGGWITAGGPALGPRQGRARAGSVMGVRTWSMRGEMAALLMGRSDLYERRGSNVTVS